MIHHYTFYMTGTAYAEGYDRIFGKKAKNGKSKKLQKQSRVQKMARLRAHAQSIQGQDSGENQGQSPSSETL